MAKKVDDVLLVDLNKMRSFGVTEREGRRGKKERDINKENGEDSNGENERASEGLRENKGGESCWED